MGYITMTFKIIDSDYIVNFLHSRSKTGVIISALNLFMLGFLRQHPSFPNSAIFWCDGLMGSVFMRLKGCSTKRLRGVEMLKATLIANKGRAACILGSCNDAANKVLMHNNVEVTQHYSLDSLNLDSFDFSSIFLGSDLVLVTLPSPKQELLSLKLAAIPANHHKHFICIGGALNMLSNPELDCPRYLQISGLEFLFRLRTDPFRRINRLFKSLVLSLLNFSSLKKYKLVIIKK